jgi:hypothetical protein
MSKIWASYTFSKEIQKIKFSTSKYITFYVWKSKTEEQFSW